MRQLIIVIGLLFFPVFCCSQEYSRLDSLQIGRYYKVVLFDDTEVTGSLLSQDSLFITLQSEHRIVSVRKNDVLRVSTDVSSSSRYRFIATATGGLCFLTPNFYGGDRQYKWGLSFHAGGMYLMEESRGLQFHFSYSRITRGESDYPAYGYPPNQYEGGVLNFYSFKLGLALGNLNAATGFYGYGSFGAGIHVSRTEELQIKSYSYSDSTYHTHTTPATSETYLVLSLGAAGGYKLTKNFSVLAEVEYDMISTAWWFYQVGYFPMRLGVSYFFK